MSNLSTSADILDDILFRSGEKTDGTSDYHAQALIYLNRSYRALYMGGMEFNPKFHENWYWMDTDDVSSGVIEAVIKTGTVDVTRGSTSITFSIAPSISVAFHRFRVDGDEDMFRLSVHTAGSTSATLLNPYTGTTGSGKTFRLMKFQYDLPTDTIKIASPIYFSQDGGRECKLVDYKDILKFWASGEDLSGVPQMFSFHQGQEDKISFERYGSDTENEKMLYHTQRRVRPADLLDNNAEPIVPLQWRHVLSDLALFFIYMDKNDDRMVLVGKQAEAGLQAMKIENRAVLAEAGEPGHIFPRSRQTVRRVRTSSGKLIGFLR